MERHELLERLAPLIPPPRAHQVRYHGVLAPCASGQDRVVPARTDGEGDRPAAGTPNICAFGGQQSGSAESKIGQTSDVDAPPCRPVDRGAMVAGADQLMRFPGVPLQDSSQLVMRVTGSGLK